MQTSVVSQFETGRFIKFPNVSSFVSADRLTAYYHLHHNQDFGIVSQDRAEANREAIKEGKGEVVSEYSVSESVHVQFTTTIGFKTVITMIDSEGSLIVSGY